MKHNFEDLAANIQCCIIQLRTALLPSTMTRTNLSDASRNLEELVEITSRAAHKTIEIAEEQQKIYQNNKDKIAPSDLENLQRLSLDLIIAQEYQDLSGQVLKKVVTLVSKVESELDKLLNELGASVEKSKVHTPVNQDSTDELLNAFKS